MGANGRTAVTSVPFTHIREGMNANCPRISPVGAFAMTMAALPNGGRMSRCVQAAASRRSQPPWSDQNWTRAGSSASVLILYSSFIAISIGRNGVPLLRLEVGHLDTNVDDVNRQRKPESGRSESKFAKNRCEHRAHQRLHHAARRRNWTVSRAKPGQRSA